MQKKFVIIMPWKTLDKWAMMQIWSIKGKLLREERVGSTEEWVGKKSEGARKKDIGERGKGDCDDVDYITNYFNA